MNYCGRKYASLRATVKGIKNILNVNKMFWNCCEICFKILLNCDNMYV